MKKILLLLFFFSLSYNSNSQQICWVSPPTVLAQNAADVKIITDVIIANWTITRSHSVTVDTINKKINLVSCYLYNYINTANSYLTDTINVGALSVGNYILNYTVFISHSYPNCVPFDTTANSYPFYSFSTNIQKFGDSRQFEISPNPTSNLIKINLYDKATILKKVEITNTLGDKVLEINYPFLNDNIDLSSLKKGLYLLSIYTDRKTFIKKIIKE